MIVVADTSPINYLIQIEAIELLPALYGSILLPPEVLAELRFETGPRDVQAWAEHLPTWASIRSASMEMHPATSKLDAGERAALNLAIEVKADMLLADERKARQIALGVFGISVRGTLGILREAHLSGLIDGKAAFQRLCHATSFYSDDKLRHAFLQSLEK